MEELKIKTEKLTEHIEEYLNTSYKLAIVNVTEKVSEVSAGSFLAFAVCILGSLVLFFLGIGCAIWIGNAINNNVVGYIIVAGIFLILMGILFLLRKKVIFPFIRNIIIRKIL
jgi:cytochrome c biogenesis protein CcdA